MESLAFSNISTGVYGFPLDLAAELSLAVVRESAGPPLKRVLFCCYSEPAADAYRRAYRNVGLDPDPVLRATDWR